MEPMKEGVAVVGYYTKGTIYEPMARTLVKSLEKFYPHYFIEGIDNLGSWWANTQYKPTFIKSMLETLPKDIDIVYVDVDAEFLRVPWAFKDWYNDPGMELGAYMFDRSEYKHSEGGKELLSGTVYFANTEWVMDIVCAWEQQCESNPMTFDQKCLEEVLQEQCGRFPGFRCKTIPPEYIKIFDRMNHLVTDPVITHYQASRKAKRAGGLFDTK